MLEQERSLQDKKDSVGGIPAGEDDQFEEQPGMGLFENSRAHITFTTDCLLLPLTKAIAFLEIFKSSRPITDEGRSMSLPSSPILRRCRIESVSTEKVVERTEVLVELKGASQKLRPMSLGCEENEVSREVSRLDIIEVFSEANNNYYSKSLCTVKVNVFEFASSKVCACFKREASTIYPLNPW